MFNNKYFSYCKSHNFLKKMMWFFRKNCENLKQKLCIRDIFATIKFLPFYSACIRNSSPYFCLYSSNLSHTLLMSNFDISRLLKIGYFRSICSFNNFFLLQIPKYYGIWPYIVHISLVGAKFIPLYKDSNWLKLIFIILLS